MVQCAAVLSIWLLGLSACVSPVPTSAISIAQSSPTISAPTPSHTLPPTGTPLPSATLAPPSPTPELLCQLLTPSSQGNLTCRSERGGFELLLPPNSALSSSSELTARIDLPFTPVANLSEKYLEITIGERTQPCSSPLTHGYQPGSIPAELVQVGDLEFIREAGSEGAAGSIYDWVAYSIPSPTDCISLNFVLHASNPLNYATPPPTYAPEQETGIFEVIVSSFRWLQP